MDLNFSPHSPTYSTSPLDRNFYGIVPANSQMDCSASTQGDFKISRVKQSDILRILDADLTDPCRLTGLYDVSLKEVLISCWQSVGQVIFSNNHLGSCTLISHNLALVPCHIIEGFDVRNMTAIFGRARASMTETLNWTSYKVLGVVECDPNIDYAILALDGMPGKNHGFLSFANDTTAATALLHYPLGKPQKISVHTVDQTLYNNLYRNTFHDTDYGSSGGAYITPRGTLTAIHLGSERIPSSLNLLRLALPIESIINAAPNGILSRLARPNLIQDSCCRLEILSYFLILRERNFIDVEKYNKKNLVDNIGYYVRRPTETFPGIVIDSHQKKHSPNWPGPSQSGARGSTFPRSISVDETIIIAELITNNIDLFKEFKTSDTAPPEIRLDINKENMGKEFFKKLKDYRTINIHAAFKLKIKSWEIHFFPA